MALMLFCKCKTLLILINPMPRLACCYPNGYWYIDWGTIYSHVSVFPLSSHAPPLSFSLSNPFIPLSPPISFISFSSFSHTPSLSPPDFPYTTFSSPFSLSKSLSLVHSHPLPFLLSIPHSILYFSTLCPLLYLSSPVSFLSVLSHHSHLTTSIHVTVCFLLYSAVAHTAFKRFKTINC